MRMSCNGCRVLRKGCSENCTIRPCLEWIKNSESQANVTVFLAKFYGRAGLMKLINAGPDHLRPAIFRSLLYEACGRIVNPIYGSVGLLWSGNWQLCQAAVEAVLKGVPVVQLPSETAATGPGPPLHKACLYDIRHVSKEDAGGAAAAVHDLHKVNRTTRTRLKRSKNHCGSSADGDCVEPAAAKRQCCPVTFQGTPSHESSASQASEPSPAVDAAVPRDADSREKETSFSMEMVEGSMVTTPGAAEASKVDFPATENREVELELELKLGIEPQHHSRSPHGSWSSSSSSYSRGLSPTWSSPRPAASCRRDDAMETASAETRWG